VCLCNVSYAWQNSNIIPMHMTNNGMIYACFLGHCASQGISETCVLIGIVLLSCQLFESQRYKFIDSNFDALFLRIITSVVFVLFTFSRTIQVLILTFCGLGKDANN